MIVSTQSEGTIRWRVLSRIHLAVKVANEMDYQFCLFRHFYRINSAPLASGYLRARSKNNKYLARGAGRECQKNYNRDGRRVHGVPGSRGLGC
jgi:hypothetical protein